MLSKNKFEMASYRTINEQIFAGNFDSGYKAFNTKTGGLLAVPADYYTDMLELARKAAPACSKEDVVVAIMRKKKSFIDRDFAFYLAGIALAEANSQKAEPEVPKIEQKMPA